MVGIGCFLLALSTCFLDVWTISTLTSNTKSSTEESPTTTSSLTSNATETRRMREECHLDIIIAWLDGIHSNIMDVGSEIILMCSCRNCKNLTLLESGERKESGQAPTTIHKLSLTSPAHLQHSYECTCDGRRSESLNFSDYVCQDECDSQCQTELPCLPATLPSPTLPCTAQRRKFPEKPSLKCDDEPISFFERHNVTHGQQRIRASKDDYEFGVCLSRPCSSSGQDWTLVEGSLNRGWLVRDVPFHPTTPSILKCTFLKSSGGTRDQIRFVLAKAEDFQNSTTLTTDTTTHEDSSTAPDGTPESTTTTTTTEKSKMEGWKIAVIAVCGCLLLLIIFLIVFICYRKSAEKRDFHTVINRESFSDPVTEKTSPPVEERSSWRTVPVSMISHVSRPLHVKKMTVDEEKKQPSGKKKSSGKNPSNRTQATQFSEEETFSISPQTFEKDLNSDRVDSINDKPISHAPDRLDSINDKQISHTPREEFQKTESEIKIPSLSSEKIIQSHSMYPYHLHH